MTIEVLDELGVHFDQKAIGRALRDARLAARITFRDLEKASGISSAQILRMEHGDSEYSIIRFVRLCACLGLPLGDVLESAMLDGPLKNKWQVSAFPAVQEAVARAQAAGGDAAKTIADIDQFALHLYRVAALVLLGSRPSFNTSAQPCPSPRCQAALENLAKSVSKWSSPQRLATLRGLIARPLETMASLGLFVAPLLDDVAAMGNIHLPGRESETLRKNLLAAAQAGPKARRAMAKLGTVFAGFNAVVGKFGVDNLRHSVNSPSVPVTLKELRQRLEAATTEPGSKGKLATFIGVHQSRVSEWLAEVEPVEPRAEVAFKLLAWVTAEEAKTKSAPGGITPKAPKTRPRKAPNEKKQHPQSRRTRRSGKH